MVQINGGGSEDNLNVPLDATAFLAVVSFFAVFLLVIFVYVNKKWRLLNVGATPGTTTKHAPLHSKAQYRSKIGEDYSSSPEPCFDQEDEEDVDLKRHHNHHSHHNQTQSQSYYQLHHLYSQQHEHHLQQELQQSNLGDIPRHPIFLSSSTNSSSFYHYHEDEEEEFPESEGLYSTVRDVDGPVLRESSIISDKRMAHQQFSHTPPPPPPHSHHHSHSQGSYKTTDAGPSSSSSNYVAHHSSSTPTSTSSGHHHQQQQHMNVSSAISASASTTVPSNTNTHTHTNISSNVKSSTPLTASPGQGSCHSSLSHHSHSHSQSHGHGHGQSQSHRQGHSSSTPAMTNFPSSSEQLQQQHHQQNTQVIQHPYPASSEVRSIRPLRVSSIRDIDDMTMSTTSRRRPHHRGFTRSNTGPGRMMSRRESGNDLISLAEEGKINGGTGSESSTSSNASDDLHHLHNHHAHNGGSHLHHSRNESALFHSHPLTLRHSNSVPSPKSNSNSNSNHNQNQNHTTNNNINNNSSTSTSNSNYTTNNNSNIMNNNNNNNPSTSTTSNNHSISNQNSNPHQNHGNMNTNTNNNGNHVIHHQNSLGNSASASNTNTNTHAAIAGTSTGVNHNTGVRGDVVTSQRSNPVISRSVAASSVNANQRRLMCMPPRIKSVDSESPPPSEQELSTYGDSIDDHIFEVEEMSLVGSDLGGLDVNRVPSTSLSLPCGSLEVAFDYEAAARKMTVHIIQARGVPSKDIGGSNNTQVRIVLLPNRKQKYKTKVLAGENPKFMESFVFSKINPEDVSSFGIRFRLYGCERILRRERLLGECILMFESLHLELETILWLSLEPRYEWKSRSQDLCRSDSASSTASIQNGIPELLIGLAYNGTTGRLTVEVIKGSFFRNLAGGKAPDSYVKLVLVSSTGHDMGRAKTSLRRSHSNPLFKETFMFQVALFQISEVTLLVSLYGRKGVTRRELLGWFAFGNSSSGDEETTHWEDMCDAGGDQICRWHVLLQS